MKRLFKIYAILLIFIMSLEIAFRYISNINVWSLSLIRIFLGANVLAIFLGFLFSWFPKSISKLLTLVISLFLSIYAFLQLGFNNFIGVYMSFNTRSQLGAVKEYVREFLGSFLGKYYFIFVPFLLLVIFFVFVDKSKSEKSNKRFPLKKESKYGAEIKTISTILLLAFTIGLYYESLSIPFMQNELQTVTNASLFKNPSIPGTVVNEFGILGFGFLDIKSIWIENEEIPIYQYNNNSISSSDNEKEKRRIFDDTLWKNIIDNEQNKIMKSISSYLINNTITDYNEYTGLFEGKNLIVIMLESVNDIIINEEYFPNFYKMYNEGWYIKNNYSPRNSCATINNEFSGMTGLYTINNTCTANMYKNNTYSTSIFNLFDTAGYKTSSMHDYTEAYYYRSTIHKNMGSGAFYGVQQLVIPYRSEYENWADDEKFFDKAMDIVLEDTENPFMLWLTTVSAHQPYVVSSVEGDKYLDLFANTDYSLEMKRYLSKLKIDDNALGVLLDRLEMADILDDTVIVMYGDHYPYGLSKNTISTVLEYDLDEYEVERVPMVIYNRDVEKEEIDKYSSYINLTPTLANLFGLDYDPRLYMGTDIFDENYLNIVTFGDGSWKNDIAYYNAATGKIKYYTDEVLSEEEIIRINSIINSKMQISSLIIKNNYFNYMDEVLKEYEKENSSLAIGISKEEK